MAGAMADDFFLDPVELQDLTNKLEATGVALGDAQRTLSSRLDKHKGAWGRDDIGKAFEKGYYDNAEDIRVGAGNAASGISDTAHNIAESGAAFQSVDEESAAWMDSHPKQN